MVSHGNATEIVGIPSAQAGIPWCRMVFHGIPSANTGIPWYRMVSHGIAWYRMVLHGIAHKKRAIPFFIWYRCNIVWYPQAKPCDTIGNMWYRDQISWYPTTKPCDTKYFMVSHGIAWYRMVSHGIPGRDLVSSSTQRELVFSCIALDTLFSVACKNLYYRNTLGIAFTRSASGWHSRSW